MNQELIVYIIIGVTIALVLYFSLRKKHVKKAPGGNTPCETGGCSGCALKDQCN
jgi:hypothetical protein